MVVFNTKIALINCLISPVSVIEIKKTKLLVKDVYSRVWEAEESLVAYFQSNEIF